MERFADGLSLATMLKNEVDLPALVRQNQAPSLERLVQKEALLRVVVEIV